MNKGFNIFVKKTSEKMCNFAVEKFLLDLYERYKKAVMCLERTKNG